MALTLRSITTTLALAAAVTLAPVAHAINFGDMFNPGRWMGGNNDDDYYDGPYGGYGPYGGGPWGPGYGGFGYPGYGGYGVPGYGYGASPYGYAPGGYAPGFAPGYAVPAAPSAASSETASDTKDQQIEALQRRIEQLEGRQSAPRMPSSAPGVDGSADSWPSAPAFRPMDQY